MNPEPQGLSTSVKRLSGGRKAVTICVATIAEKNTLIAACDRMVTAGDTEFELGQAKIWLLSNSIVALLSGDLTKQAEIMKEVHTTVQYWIVQNPTVQVRVADVVALYCGEYRKLLRHHAERDILSPFGLDLPTFLASQNTFNQEFLNEIRNHLLDYSFPIPLETIIMGHDKDGPLGLKGEELIYTKLYSLDGDRSSLRTTVGFAAIGGGKFHAESEITFMEHAPSKPFHETIFLTYAAKKRAEVAPGVGKTTDVVVLGPALNTFLKIEDRHVGALEKMYQKYRGENLATLDRTRKSAMVFVKEARKYYAEKSKTKAAKAKNKK